MKAPDRIWLQWHGDVWDLDSLPALDDSTDGPSETDVTWSSHEVFDADVEYVRRDAPAPAGDQVERPTVPGNAHCCTCRWWAARPARQNDTDNPRSGQCHLNAPTVVPMGAGTATLWPTTLRYSVCGDWERGA